MRFTSKIPIYLDVLQYFMLIYITPVFLRPLHPIVGPKNLPPNVGLPPAESSRTSRKEIHHLPAEQRSLNGCIFFVRHVAIIAICSGTCDETLDFRRNLSATRSQLLTPPPRDSFNFFVRGSYLWGGEAICRWSANVQLEFVICLICAPQFSSNCDHSSISLSKCRLLLVNTCRNLNSGKNETYLPWKAFFDSRSLCGQQESAFLLNAT